MKQPPGEIYGGYRAGGRDRGGRYKFPPHSEWKVGNKHPYNRKTLLKFKHYGKIDSHADDECFDLESNAHLHPEYLENRKLQMT